MNNELLDRLSALGDYLDNERNAARPHPLVSPADSNNDGERVSVIELADRRQSISSTSSPWLLRAAAVVAVVGLGVGLVMARSGGNTVPGVSGGGASLPSVAEPADVVTMIPQQLPEPVSLGQRHGEALLVRTDPSAFQERLYSSVSDPSDPAQMVRVSYADAANLTGPPCFRIGPDGQPQLTESATVFDVEGGNGGWCVVQGRLAAGWFVDALGVESYAGSAVGPDALVELAQSFDTVAVNPVDDRRPVADLVPILPAGWVALVDSDVPFEQNIVESSWVAKTDGRDDGEQQLVVQTWSGVDDQGIYAITPPFFAERVTVRGRQGYLYESAVLDGDTKPAQVEVWWTEQPGTVVSVEANNLYDATELLAFVETLEPADTARFESFLNDPANT